MTLQTSEPALPRRVALLGSYAPSLINFRAPLIRALVDHGCEVHALAPAIDAETAARIRQLGATPHSVMLTNSALDPLSNLKTLWSLTRHFRELKPDCVISYTIKPVTLGSIAAHRAGVPRIVALITGLGYAFVSGREWRRRVSRTVGKLLYRRAFRGCNLAIFQNPDDEADFRALGVVPAALSTVQVRGSGVDTAHFSPAPLGTSPRFLMLARLLGDKGVREYAEAAVQVSKRCPAAHFTLAGDMAMVPDAISRAELDRMIANGVDYLGPLADVRPALADCTIFVLPSYREGTPRSVLEAMAMGRPIITSDAPGCRETVVDGLNGYLVPPRDPQGLAEAMLNFVRDPEQIAPMGARSRERASKLFDAGQVAESIVEAIRRHT